MGAIVVLQTLVPNAREIFKILAQERLATEEDTGNAMQCSQHASIVLALLTFQILWPHVGTLVGLHTFFEEFQAPQLLHVPCMHALLLNLEFHWHKRPQIARNFQKAVTVLCRPSYLWLVALPLRYLNVGVERLRQTQRGASADTSCLQG